MYHELCCISTFVGANFNVVYSLCEIHSSEWTSLLLCPTLPLFKDNDETKSEIDKKRTWETFLFKMKLHSGTSRNGLMSQFNTFNLLNNKIRTNPSVTKTIFDCH